MTEPNGRIESFRFRAASFALSLLAASLASAAALPPVVAEKPEAPFATMSLRDWATKAAVAHGEPQPGTPERIFGEAIDTAEKFLRLTPEKMTSSDLLSTDLRSGDEDSAGKQSLGRLVQLKRDRWYQQIVDGSLVADRLAGFIVVFVPRPAHEAKTAEALYLVRDKASWKVSFDLAKDAAALGGDAPAAAEKLRSIIEARRNEVADVVSEPVRDPLPFRGTWTTHYRTSFVYLTFDGQGEVFIFQDQPNGTSSYGVFDYHLVADEIVVEAGFGSIRLRRLPAEGREVDNRWYPTLIAEDARGWFPDFDGKEIRLSPVTKGEHPVRRPVPVRTDATRPVER